MKIFTSLLALLVIILSIAGVETAKIPDPYKVLGISRSATEDEIKKAFNKRSRQYHPDRNTQDPRAK
jgi:DnaJ-class molecular chaperone